MAKAAEDNRNYIDGDYAILTGGGYEYNIYKDRIQTYSQVVNWIYHLKDKNWVTKDDLVFVVYAAQRLNGLNPHSGL